MTEILLGISLGGFVFLKQFKPSKRYEVETGVDCFLFITIALFAIYNNSFSKQIVDFAQSSFITFSLLFPISFLLDTTKDKEKKLFAKSVFWISVFIVFAGLLWK